MTFVCFCMKNPFLHKHQEEKKKNGKLEPHLCRLCRNSIRTEDTDWPLSTLVLYPYQIWIPWRENITWPHYWNRDHKWVRKPAVPGLVQAYRHDLPKLCTLNMRILLLSLILALSSLSTLLTLKSSRKICLLIVPFNFYLHPISIIRQFKINKLGIRKNIKGPNFSR